MLSSISSHFSSSSNSREKDDSLTKSVQRILSVWEERHVFEPESISKFKTIMGTPVLFTAALCPWRPQNIKPLGMRLAFIAVGFLSLQPQDPSTPTVALVVSQM